MSFKKLSLFSILIILVLLIGPGTGPAGAEAQNGFFVIADFEAGAPAGFVPFADSWDGSGSSTTLTMDTQAVELPAVPTGTSNTVLSVAYDIAASGGWGGGPGYGGVTHDFAATQDWSAFEAFTFWFQGSNSGAAMRVELKSDGTGAGASNRYEYTFTDDSDGWRFFSLPWDAFVQRTDFNPGPSPTDPINLAAMWGYSLLLPGGASGSFYLDHVAVTNAAVVADFEAGAPTGFVPFADSWDGSGSSTTLTMDTQAVELPAVPAASGNTVLSVEYDIAASGGWGGGPGYGGVTHDFATTRDWSAYDAFTFWFQGSNSGAAMRIELKSDGTGAGASNRYEYTFTDDNAGWRFFSLPWDAFAQRTDYNPGPSPADPINLTAMWGYSLLLPGGASGSFYLDQVSLHGISAATEPWMLVDDFESGLPSGFDSNGIPIGFFTALGGGSMELADESAPPAPVLPELGEPNKVLAIDVETGSWAVAIHGFENEAVDTWVSQDWSAFEGFAFWLYGNNSGIDLFVDLIENRNPDSDTDDAQRWTVRFKDDFEGWQYRKFPFNTFTMKNIGNGAPGDGLTLDEVHGWAFGTESTDGPRTFYLDQVAVYGQAPERPLQVEFDTSEYESVEGAAADVTVKLTRPLKEDDPDQVSVAYTTDGGSAIVDRDYTPVSGAFTFVKGGPSEQSFTIPTYDNNKHDGDKRVILRLGDAVDVELGFVTQASLTILDDDPLDELLLDDFEGYPYLWQADSDIGLSQMEIPAGDPVAIPGQGAFEGILQVTTPLAVEIDVMSANGYLCNKGNGVVPVAILTTDAFDATTVDHTTVRFGDAGEAHIIRKSGEITRHEEDVDGDGDVDLIFHFRFAETGFGCDAADAYLTGRTFDGQAITAGFPASFGRDFALHQDWSFSEGLNFWYYGAGGGDTITVQLKDNRAPDPGPSGWSLVWSDEFNDPAGTPPNPANWGYEIGDGTINGIPGWGNDERQYYTDSTDNVATDGQGNLVITAREADGTYLCYYGTCEYTSARLVSKHRAEFAYGRIESRILVPDGEDGLWPAFWSLGTDIDEVDWPQTGEIDIMEYVSRIPDEIFGTIHGPGYSGGVSYGNTYEFPGGVANDYHTFAIEWQPDLINWYVDGILYHTAEPDDVAPNEWVFNDPIYLLLNMAVGGNFGGTVSDDTVFPQEMTVDYVRVFQGPDTAERFEATFVDDFNGWQKVEIPFSAFTRSTDQPAGAPDDGLGLNEVWGYGFQVEGTVTGSLMLDQVRLNAPLAITVENNNDSGPGSLRQAIAAVANGGTISFNAGLAGDTITLSSGPLVISKDVLLDGSDAPGLTVSGAGVHRVFIVDPGADAYLSHLTVADGYGWQLAGGILNNGQLTLDHVTVTGNTMATDAGDFWQGGGGIYNGGDSVLRVFDSTVSGNSSGWSGGGIYAFFGSTTTIVRSTISGNVAQDVGGGLRTLSGATIENSTISGNTAVGWHGGGAFITDGVVDITNSTVTANSAPGGTAGGLFVGTFTEASATLNLQNTIVAANGDFGCFLAPFGAGAVALNSLGNNVFSDDSCFPIGSDQIVADAGLGGLADNGGPTLTHALQAGSPAIDAAAGAACPAVDQRGVARPQGAGCDVGSFELAP